MSKFNKEIGRAQWRKINGRTEGGREKEIEKKKKKTKVPVEGQREQ